MCAHVVAVLLTAREHLTQEAEEMQQIPSWRDRLQQWVSTVKPVHKKAAIALFSLQREEYSYYTYSDQWRLKPYYVAINPLIERGIEQEVIFDPDQLDVILRHYDLTTLDKGNIRNRAR